MNIIDGVVINNGSTIRGLRQYPLHEHDEARTAHLSHVLTLVRSLDLYIP